MNDLLNKMNERYQHICVETGLIGTRPTITYQLSFNENCFAFEKFSHRWGGNPTYNTLAIFYSTMTDEQIIEVIKLIMGAREFGL